MYVCGHIYIYIYIYGTPSLSADEQYVCIYICNTYIYIYIYICTYICIPTYAYIYIYIHTHIGIRMIYYVILYSVILCYGLHCCSQKFTHERATYMQPHRRQTQTTSRGIDQLGIICIYTCIYIYICIYTYAYIVSILSLF